MLFYNFCFLEGKFLHMIITNNSQNVIRFFQHLRYEAPSGFNRLFLIIFFSVVYSFSGIASGTESDIRYNVLPSENFNADRKSIDVDGDLSDWAGVTFIRPLFDASDGRVTGKGNVDIEGTTYSTFAEYGGGTWSGPDDHSTTIAVAWDQGGLYLGIVVTDDEHEHAASNAWNGDGVQMGLTNSERNTVTHLYNYAIKDGYESGQVYMGGNAQVIAEQLKGGGSYSVAMVRDDESKITTYEVKFNPDSFGFSQFEVGQQFGFGVCVNDGDQDTPGQKGWSGWGPHLVIFGQTAPDAALVTLANEAAIRNSLSTLRDAALHFSIGHAPNDVNTTTIRHGLYAQSPFSPQGQIDLAASGFSLAALPAAVENGLITKDNAQVIALNAAARIKEMTQKSASASTDDEILKYGYKGMLYHYCDWNESDQKFHRSNTMGYEVEISSVDTAILMWGMFISANYFEGDVKADYLTARDSIDWSAWVDTDSDHLNQFRMAYQPGAGFAGWWDWYTQETMLIVLMAAMSNDDIVVEDLWRAWKREEVTYQSPEPNSESFTAYATWFGDPFTIFYAQAFFDLERLQTDLDGVNWYDQARTAYQGHIEFFAKERNYLNNLSTAFYNNCCGNSSTFAKPNAGQGVPMDNPIKEATIYSTAGGLQYYSKTILENQLAESLSGLAGNTEGFFDWHGWPVATVNAADSSHPVVSNSIIGQDISLIGLSVDNYLNGRIYDLVSADNDFIEVVQKLFPSTFPKAPVANAGQAQTVDEGVTVVLDGSGSDDANGDTLTYAWVAPAGITLSDATVVNPVFTAPEVDSDTDFTLSLVVNDGQVDSVESTVVVTVSDVAPVALTAKNAYAIQIDDNTNIVLDSTIGDVGLNGSVWAWYSGGVASDASNSLSVFLTGVRNAATHRMTHRDTDPGSLGQTTGSGTYQYNYTGIPGGGNDSDAKGVVLKYTATEERTLLIETTGGAYNDSVVIIFTEAHLNGGVAPFRVVTQDSGDPTTFKVKFPYFTDNPDANIYYIALTSYNSSDLGAGVPLRITSENVTSSNAAPVANAGAAQTVDEGVTVVLDGGGSDDADAGDTLTYAWVAPAGITLSDATVVNPVFTAPEVDSDTDFTLSLVVNDGQVDSVESTVVVTVSDVAPVAPTSEAPSGSGTESDPYLISSLNNLYWLSQTSSEWGSGKYFKQTADIDAAINSWNRLNGNW